MRHAGSGRSSAPFAPAGQGRKGSSRTPRPTLRRGTPSGGGQARPALQPEEIEDVILGCAMPEAEQGMNVARIAALWRASRDVAGDDHQPLLLVGPASRRATVADRILAGRYEAGIGGRRRVHEPGAHGRQQSERQPGADGAASRRSTRPWASPRRTSPRASTCRARTRTSSRCEPAARGGGAGEAGKFKEEIAPVEAARVVDDSGKARRSRLTPTRVRAGHHARGPRKLKPAFDKEGTVTAGNASADRRRRGRGGVETRKAPGSRLSSRSATAWLPGGGRAAGHHGHRPGARGAQAAREDKLTSTDIDVFELNEAFAAQSLYCMRELGLDGRR